MNVSSVPNWLALAGFIPEDWARQCNMGAARGLSMSDR